MEFTSSHSGFRSNRSYPALNHISLTPLTPRFPIDDDDEPQEYYSAQDDSSEDPYSAHIPQSRTSYLTSRSVPGTPGVLSSSRSASRSRHARSKSSTRSHITDPNLQTQDISPQFAPRKKSSRGQLGDPTARPDSEWMLRTGIALASSTREEKGQSWLQKRQSSTSLVSEGDEYGFDPPYHHTHSWTGGKSRSGASTPALSRRASRSRGGSRRNSRAGLAMTSLDMSSQPHSRPSRSGMASPADELKEFMPAMVDKRIRDEFDSIQHDREEDMLSLDAESESEDEIDEAEMQRLTRERGFGLGGWFDRLLGWTLFGVDDFPASRVQVSFNEPSRDVSRSRSRERSNGEEEDVEDDDVSVDIDRDNESTIPREYDTPTIIDKPGERGGWEDAQWLLRVMKNALL
ncbi:hypothetical protein PHISCL_00573 [Aspergillus sclerotialis]|uniref:Uncharacterized protein n=1 Tax=Aspergillus sclerotialis TaxID=2070753 RepID=A0A3A2ZVN4_9EURO|nr:hypothetical protein PHISCL_00573 [Aspergillus sclerotialis]